MRVIDMKDFNNMFQIFWSSHFVDVNEKEYRYHQFTMFEFPFKLYFFSFFFFEINLLRDLLLKSWFMWNLNINRNKLIWFISSNLEWNGYTSFTCITCLKYSYVTLKPSLTSFGFFSYADNLRRQSTKGHDRVVRKGISVLWWQYSLFVWYN